MTVRSLLRPARAVIIAFGLAALCASCGPASTPCATGTADCDGLAVNGCEQSLSTVGSCGACGHSCDDADPCTVDRCDASGGGGAFGCVHVPVTACGAACDARAGCGWADTDDDGLSDAWERAGYIDIDCNGRRDEGIDTPLPDADPKRPNVYVKIDYLEKPGGAHTHRPSAAALALVRDAFARHDAILSYFPTSEALPERSVVTLSPPEAIHACAGPDAVSLYALKAAHFPAALAPAYHYVVFAHYNTCDDPARCNQCPHTDKVPFTPPFASSGLAELPGNDVIISLGQLSGPDGPPPSDEIVAGALLHELGHNLGLRHGGGDDLNLKPNYLSVMNYAYLQGIGVAATASFPTAAFFDPVSLRVDYSGFTAGTLDEGRFEAKSGCVDDGSGGLDERVGITGGDPMSRDIAMVFSGGATYYAPSSGAPIDWNANGDATEPHVFADVNGNGSCEPLKGFNDWAAESPSPGVTRLTNLFTGFACNTGNWADGPPLASATVAIDDAPASMFALPSAPRVTRLGVTRAH